MKNLNVWKEAAIIGLVACTLACNGGNRDPFKPGGQGYDNRMPLQLDTSTTSTKHDSARTVDSVISRVPIEP